MMLGIQHGLLAVSILFGSCSARQHYHSARVKVSMAKQRGRRGRGRLERVIKEERGRGIWREGDRGREKKERVRETRGMQG